MNATVFTGKALFSFTELWTELTKSLFLSKWQPEAPAETDWQIVNTRQELPKKFWSKNYQIDVRDNGLINWIFLKKLH